MHLLRLRYSGLGLIRTYPRLYPGTTTETVKVLDVYLPRGNTMTAAHEHNPTLAIPVDMLTDDASFDRCVALWDPMTQAPRLWAQWFLKRVSLSIKGATGPTSVRLLHPEPRFGPLDASDSAEWSALNWLASLSLANSMNLDLAGNYADLTSPDLNAHLKLGGGTLSVLPPSPPHRMLRWDFGAYTKRAFSDSFKYVLANPDTMSEFTLELTPFDGSPAVEVTLDPQVLEGECFVGNFESVKVPALDAVEETQAHVRALNRCVQGGSPTALPTKSPGVNPVFCFLARI